MPIYTYIGNLDPSERTTALVLRGGALILRLGRSADLTMDEYDELFERYNLVPGSVPPPVPPAASGAVTTDGVGDLYGPDGTLILATASAVSVAGQAANKVPVTNGSNGYTFSGLASVSSATPNPDTPDGSDDTTSGTVSGGLHSHPQSDLYDAHGLDDVNTVVSSGATVTIPDPSVQQSSVITLTAATVTVTLPAAAIGKRFTVAWTQDATGSRVPLYPPTMAWIGAAHPTWSTLAGKIDVIEHICLDGLNWIGIPLALGVISPAAPLTIVQTVNGVLLDGGILTFADDITPGNSIVGIVGNQTGSANVLPSGGGCTDWAEIEAGWDTPLGSDIASLAPAPAIHVFYATDSTGAPGSGTITAFNPSGIFRFFMEIQGRIALDGSPVTGTGTVTTAGETFTTPVATAAASGEMPIVIAYVAEDNGTTNMTTGAGWTQMPILAISEQSTNPGATMRTLAFGYQLGTTPGGTYQGQCTVPFNTTHTWVSLGFILKRA